MLCGQHSFIEVNMVINTKWKNVPHNRKGNVAVNRAKLSSEDGDVGNCFTVGCGCFPLAVGWLPGAKEGKEGHRAQWLVHDGLGGSRPGLEMS